MRNTCSIIPTHIEVYAPDGMGEAEVSPRYDVVDLGRREAHHDRLLRVDPKVRSLWEADGL